MKTNLYWSIFLQPSGAPNVSIVAMGMEENDGSHMQSFQGEHT